MGIKGDTGSVLYINQDLTNSISLGFRPTITPGGPNTVTVPPNGSVSLPTERTTYAAAPNGTTPMVIIPGGASYFQGLTQGLGTLVAPSIHSPNFNLQLGTGWSINRDGSAFFGSNVSTIGDVFLYFPTPGPGRLILSIANNAGTDRFGNRFPQGISISGAAGAGIIQVRPDKQAQLFYAN